MAIKGPKEYFAVSISKTIKNMSACETGVSMAQDLRNINPDINMIHCSNLLLISSFHRRDDTELLHHAKIIHDCPNLCNLFVRNAEHFDPFDHDSFSCGWDPHELALVCAVRGPDLRHFISFGDNFVGRDMQVWEGGKVRLTETFKLLVIPIPTRKVYDEIGAEILIESSYILLVPEFCCLDPDEILVLFFHKLCLPPYF